ncbi:mercuric transport protein MerT [Aneurinibacillus thermoaerophilus]|uniref:mercuric transport protein MerT n=1 Tax=Aneurinibacillus thermoaerophilus TaxID=143495 RepID=UPI002E1C8AA4|nr:mercuric transport protein MerT [Aneurinibacillus thermoaerophilus]
MKEKFSSLITVLSAFVMAGCCLGPLILVPLGLTSVAATLAIFATKYQLILMIVTLIMLGISAFLVYGRKCSKRSTITFFWLSTGLVIALFGYTLFAKGYI